MNAWLLYRDRESDFNNAGLNRNEIIQDLNLDIILKFMARNDEFLYRASKIVLTTPLTDKAVILYRQQIVEDCIQNNESFVKIYEIVSKVIEEIEKYKEGAKRANSSNLSDAAAAGNTLEYLCILVVGMEKLKEYIDTIEEGFGSCGMRAFYSRLFEDYNTEFVDEVKASIRNVDALKSGGEITFSSTVGQGFKAKDIIVNHLGKDTLKDKKITGYVSLLVNRFIHRKVIMLDNTKLKEDAHEMEAAGMAHVTKLYTGFIQEYTAFFENLHFQIAFYIGAANLRLRLNQMHVPVCTPRISDKDEEIFKFKGLYDLSLAIYSRSRPISNDLDTADKKLFIITGANQGGKSTYLRSIGIAQLLMQCGMFVPAEYYRNKLFNGIFSHFTRREDTAMNSGKLDEELSRMSRILNSITPDSLLLMNESFASTTEREGTQIALDVVNALYENNTKIVMVTHLFEFTKTMFEKKPDQAVFLSAERLEDGTRTFRMLEKEPERTSYGLDLYDAVLNNKAI